MAEKWLSTGARVCGVDPVADQSAVPEGAEVIEGGSEEMSLLVRCWNILKSPSECFRNFTEC